MGKIGERLKEFSSQENDEDKLDRLLELAKLRVQLMGNINREQCSKEVYNYALRRTGDLLLFIEKVIMNPMQYLDSAKEADPDKYPSHRTETPKEDEKDHR